MTPIEAAIRRPHSGWCAADTYRGRAADCALGTGHDGPCMPAAVADLTPPHGLSRPQVTTDEHGRVLNRLAPMVLVPLIGEVGEWSNVVPLAKPSAHGAATKR